MIEAHQISVKIGAQFLLQGVSLKILPGEVVAVIGPNGAGKSTLLKVLSGEWVPSDGEVWMAGRPLRTWSILERARRRAVLPQDSTLAFPFTALEVVLMGRTPHCKDLERACDYEIARTALIAVGALHLEARLYPTLSGGERQRVQLARVLAQIGDTFSIHPCYLLLDEPIARLDLIHQYSTLQIVRDFARAGVGVLLILHDLNLVAQYADRIALLKSGRLIAEGSPWDVLTPEVIQSAFAMSVVVIPHPYLGCPLVIPSPGPDLVPNSVDLIGRCKEKK